LKLGLRIFFKTVSEFFGIPKIVSGFLRSDSSVGVVFENKVGYQNFVNCELVVFVNLSSNLWNVSLWTFDLLWTCYTCELWTCDLWKLVTLWIMNLWSLWTCKLWTCELWTCDPSELVLFSTFDNCDLIILWTRYIEIFSSWYVYRSHFKFWQLPVHFPYELSFPMFSK
jgi:hypothetical protein